MNVLGFIGKASASMALISTAFASSAGAAPAAAQPSMWPTMGIMLMVMGAVYFLMIRPQSKQQKERQNMLSNLREGDAVAMSGGLLGHIKTINNDFVVLSVGDGINLTFQRGAVGQVLPNAALDDVLKAGQKA